MVIAKTKVTWDEIEQSIELLHNRTHNNNSVAIIGIARGGLIPATLLSQLKNNSVVYSIGVKSYSKTLRGKETIYQIPDKQELQKYDTIYIVDDICDTGLTFKYLLERHFFGLNVKTISLYYRHNSLYTPDYYTTKLLDDSWVVFPWEKE